MKDDAGTSNPFNLKIPKESELEAIIIQSLEQQRIHLDNGKLVPIPGAAKKQITNQLMEEMRKVIGYARAYEEVTKKQINDLLKANQRASIRRRIKDEEKNNRSR